MLNTKLILYLNRFVLFIIFIGGTQNHPKGYNHERERDGKERNMKNGKEIEYVLYINCNSNDRKIKATIFLNLLIYSMKGSD